MIEWRDAQVKDFYAHTKDIKVAWLRDFDATDTRVRKATVTTNEGWRSFSQNALLPWYKNGLGWSNPGSENYTLRDFAREHQDDSNHTLRAGLLRVISVYHSILDRRLLVDGCHRAVPLEKEVIGGRPIPRVELLECYGSQVHAVFPCDFCNVIRNSLR